MKKLFSKCFNAVLIVALSLTLCPALSTMAEEEVSEFVMDGTTITGYNGPGGDVTLPATATAVADYAFAGNGNISSVVIPANVTSVGSYSFSGCGGLSSVVFGGSVSLGSNSGWRWLHWGKGVCRLRKPWLGDDSFQRFGNRQQRF